MRHLEGWVNSVNHDKRERSCCVRWHSVGPVSVRHGSTTRKVSEGDVHFLSTRPTPRMMTRLRLPWVTA
jgi:hypothetical protein